MKGSGHSEFAACVRGAYFDPPYTIGYSYGGDVNFNAAIGSGSLTVSFGMTPLYDPTEAAKSGSTIPIKFQLSNAAGANVSSSSILVTAIQLVQTSTSASSTVNDSGNANPTVISALPAGMVRILPAESLF